MKIRRKLPHLSKLMKLSPFLALLYKEFFPRKWIDFLYGALFIWRLNWTGYRFETFLLSNIGRKYVSEPENGSNSKSVEYVIFCFVYVFFVGRAVLI